MFSAFDFPTMSVTAVTIVVVTAADTRTSRWLHTATATMATLDAVPVFSVLKKSPYSVTWHL